MEACGIYNLCEGIKAGIEGAVHISKKIFGRNTPPNAFSSDSHPEVVNELETVWEGGAKYMDPQDEEEKEDKSLITQTP